MNLVDVQNVSVRIEGRNVLSDVSLSVGDGEIVTIVGPNGSGKSTLLRTIVGVHRPQNGRVRLRAGARFSYAPQRMNVSATLPMTVSRFLNLQSGASRERISQALEKAGISDQVSRQISHLSGGQFQRLLLANALLNQPDLMILDEPTAGLDQAGTAAFYGAVDDARREIGCSVLMVSHELHVVMSASDRVVCLNGHVCCQGAPAVVADAPEYRALFGTGTHGALALYRHEHDHSHHHGGHV